MEIENKNYAVPVAIVIAGIIIAGAVLLSNFGNSSSGDKQNTRLDDQASQASVSVEKIKPVNESDHILGNPNADVIIVEFSDTECPFCKRFHLTMKKIIDEYGKDGKVAWVYRHFPIDQLHSKARKEAQATECAAEIGGNTAFWKYLNRIFEITPANDGLDLTKLPEIAEYVGLDLAEFEECLTSDKYADKIESQVQDAIASGAQGTPYSIAIAPNGEKVVISGAQSYEFIKTVVEIMLNEGQ